MMTHISSNTIINKHHFGEVVKLYNKSPCSHDIRGLMKQRKSGYVVLSFIT